MALVAIKHQTSGRLHDNSKLALWLVLMILFCAVNAAG
jgi:hypothetical protein